MKLFVSAALIVAGVIHLLPLSGLAGAERLAGLYGVAIEDSNLAILMRHRAILFGMLGALLVYAAFRADLQPLALAAGFVSAGSFLAIALATGDLNEALERVLIADVVALACLVAAAAGRLVAR